MFWHLFVFCSSIQRGLLLCAMSIQSGRVDRASATGTGDSGSIPDRVKPNTIKIGIHSFPAGRSAIKGTV